MEETPKVRHKIINDPVHGFIKVEGDLAMAIIDHPWFQRMRRIRQLGMTNYVYPGAQHTRFQHAIGAMHLMSMAMDTLSAKGTKVRPDERTAAEVAILLHDVGHGPFSHALENVFVQADHEDITRIIMDHFDHLYGGSLGDAMRAFRGECRPFIHQLISSQLDTDRLDYLKRDSFFSGVVEGTIGSDRIIKMLDVTTQGELAVEYKGIYTIEDFLIARRLMYWQVYLHRTVVAAERMLRQALDRARILAKAGRLPESTPTLSYFLTHDVTADDLANDGKSLEMFCNLDDDDVTISLKQWQKSDDKILSILSKGLVNRQIFNIEMVQNEITLNRIQEEKAKVARRYGIPLPDADKLVMHGKVSSKTYTKGVDRINIIYRDGSVHDFSEAPSVITMGGVTGSDSRYYICYPRAEEDSLDMALRP